MSVTKRNKELGIPGQICIFLPDHNIKKVRHNKHETESNVKLGSHSCRKQWGFSSSDLKVLPKTMVHIMRIHHVTYVRCPMFNVGVKNRQ